MDQSSTTKAGGLAKDDSLRLGTLAADSTVRLGKPSEYWRNTVLREFSEILIKEL